MTVDRIAAVLIGARWAHFASLFALLGGSAFWLSAGRFPVGQDPSFPRSRRLTVTGLRIAALLAVVSGLLWLDASIAAMTGGFAGTLDLGFLRLFFLDTPFGGIEIVRLGFLAALLAAAALPMPARRAFAFLALLAGALLVSQAWLGHAAEGGGTVRGWLMIASYAVHVLAGALWLGGLPPLLLALHEDRGKGVAALNRFSLVATAAALAVVATGTANTAFHVAGSIGALAASGYGRVLAAKLVLVAAMLLLAAWTRFVTMPRLRRGGSERPSRTIAPEAVAGLLVLLAAAVLGITPPPH